MLPPKRHRRPKLQNIRLGPLVADQYPSLRLQPVDEALRDLTPREPAYRVHLQTVQETAAAQFAEARVLGGDRLQLPAEIGARARSPRRTSLMLEHIASRQGRRA